MRQRISGYSDRMSRHVDPGAVGKAGIQHGDVDLRPGHPDPRLVRAGCLGHHLDVALGVEQGHDAAPHDLVIVQQEDTNRLHGTLLSVDPAGLSSPRPSDTSPVHTSTGISC